MGVVEIRFLDSIDIHIKHELVWNEVRGVRNRPILIDQKGQQCVPQRVAYPDSPARRRWVTKRKGEEVLLAIRFDVSGHQGPGAISSRWWNVECLALRTVCVTGRGLRCPWVKGVRERREVGAVNIEK